jgi:hypothetical protein
LLQGKAATGKIKATSGTRGFSVSTRVIDLDSKRSSL